MSAPVAPCASCGRPMPPDASRCPSCHALREADAPGTNWSGYAILLVVAVGCVLVVLKLLGLLEL